MTLRLLVFNCKEDILRIFFSVTAQLPRGGVLLGWLLPLLFMSAPAFADASRCYSIKDRDQRYYCLATARGDKSRCYAIKNRDQKNLCLAQVGSQKNRCYSIKDRDQKALCLSRF